MLGIKEPENWNPNIFFSIKIKVYKHAQSPSICLSQSLGNVPDHFQICGSAVFFSFFSRMLQMQCICGIMWSYFILFFAAFADDCWPLSVTLLPHADVSLRLFSVSSLHILPLQHSDSKQDYVDDSGIKMAWRFNACECVWVFAHVCVWQRWAC